jgi:hypothetical protein
MTGLTRPLALGAMFVATTSWPTQAHDIYANLKDEVGESCCHDRDCRPAPYRITAAGVEMLVDERWIVVPEHHIQYRTLQGDTGETAGGHWCGKMEHDITYCAVLPPSSASVISGAARPWSVPTHVHP